MGGSIRKNISQKVTHLIANFCSGEKYQYAAVFRVPAMDPQWVYASWEKRNDVHFKSTEDAFMVFHSFSSKLLLFLLILLRIIIFGVYRLNIN